MELKNHPGMWLRDDAAAAINALEDKYGIIRINSAGRTVQEQQALIDRWNKGGTYNRPPYLYEPYRPPENSPHVSDGGIAVDVYNYNSDRAKLEEFGFKWYGSKDVVHYDFVGRNTPSVNTPSTNKRGPEIMLNWAWPGIAAMLRRYAGYRGNNVPGPIMIGCFQRWLNGSGYSRAAIGRNLIDDGQWGTNEVMCVQQWLKSRWNYNGGIDADPGPGTYEAWNRAENANWIASPAWRG